MLRRIKPENFFYFLILSVSFTKFISPAMAIVLGILTAIILNAPIAERITPYSNNLLKIAVIGLGFSLNIVHIITVGSNAIWITLIGITLTMIVGIKLGIWFRTEKKTSMLITAGTAICGGSAIAAIAPAIHANRVQTAVALSSVFLLNSIALVSFPFIGKFLHLSDVQFGFWAAISIHDTSSVVGATLPFGADATLVGITTKLARALWILPLTFVISFLHNGKGKAPIPYFLLGFIFASIISTYVPAFNPIWVMLYKISEQLLTVTLFIIGSSLNLAAIKKAGARPLVQAFCLWIFISVASLCLIFLGLIPGI